MKVKGIRILDKANKVVSVDLFDILEEVPDGNLFHWSILCLEAMGHLGEGKSILVFEKQIDDSEKGFFIDWNELNAISKKLYQVIDITLIGCKNKGLLNRYKNNKEMYEMCDIVVEMIDSSYWEVFSRDNNFLDKLQKRFKKTEVLEV